MSYRNYKSEDVENALKAVLDSLKTTDQPQTGGKIKKNTQNQFKEDSKILRVLITDKIYRFKRYSRERSKFWNSKTWIRSKPIVIVAGPESSQVMSQNLVHLQSATTEKWIFELIADKIFRHQGKWRDRLPDEIWDPDVNEIIDAEIYITLGICWFLLIFSQSIFQNWIHFQPAITKKCIFYPIAYKIFRFRRYPTERRRLCSSKT